MVVARRAVGIEDIGGLKDLSSADSPEMKATPYGLNQG